MHNPPEGGHHEPGRGEAVVFYLKTRLLIARRWWRERGNPVPLHPRSGRLVKSSVAAEIKAPLWTQITEAEFPLTAGKVQNLRAACLNLDGIEVPAGEIFSFWKQLGRTTRGKGFTEGRELRSGCMVPNLGGGLCQLSGLIHAAALEAGLGVVESHTHSRSLPGTPLVPERDATVFWNYVDLRFSAPFDWRLECRLTATNLIVSIRAADRVVSHPKSPKIEITGSPVRADADGDCLTCGVTSCFRHPSAVTHHAAASGHTAWLLDGRLPEFNAWCLRHAHDGDRWFAPLDGQRWKKANYAWKFPAGAHVYQATLETLKRSWRQRRLPTQGAIRQQFLLDAQRCLAENYARQLDPKARHLVVSQTLLPHLWLGGHLGGRTFDVLVQRWPLSELQARLDTAAKLHPASDTLADFRADPLLVDAEKQALAAAARLVTPHRRIAESFGSRAILLDWEMPPALPTSTPSTPRWFFPASALGRKGIHELAAALDGSDHELLILGGAREGSSDPLASINHRRATVSELANCTALVLPAWIEHEPRLALRALASGIPVIASKACGLPLHPLLVEIDAGDVDALKNAMQKLASPAMDSAVA
ncbi:MAG: VanW family protein [Luteolibacter sp.]